MNGFPGLETLVGINEGVGRAVIHRDTAQVPDFKGGECVVGALLLPCVGGGW